ncbi:MAG TPA: hypothetical protein VMV21_12080 [Vicinamibacteria bacterium]|nr:hypothetical protein [Vicinamibacteria bacterium]
MLSTTSSVLPRSRFRRLYRRLVDTVQGVRPRHSDRAWVESILQPGELELWLRLSGPDQCHAIQVARSVEARLAGTPYAGDGRWLGAALLHDVGKVEAGLGILERAVATLLGKATSVDRARRWARAEAASIRRLGLYLTHGSVGAAAIRAAGGREEIAAWAEVHQALPCPAMDLLPVPVVHALSDADLE